MSNATFSAPDMTAYCGLEELGLVAVGMRCQGGGFVLKWLFAFWGVGGGVGMGSGPAR